MSDKDFKRFFGVTFILALAFSLVILAAMIIGLILLIGFVT